MSNQTARKRKLSQLHFDEGGKAYLNAATGILMAIYNPENIFIQQRKMSGLTYDREKLSSF